MPVATAAEFTALLCASKLLAPEQVALVERASTSDPLALATSLVKRGQLTKWQAEQLLGGQDPALFTLGKYRFLEKLGEGGMGAVYKAVHTILGHTVALKVMSKKVLSQPGAVARFHREIRSVAALSHPNIIAALDADQVDDSHFLVMEYAAGRDLSQWLAEYNRLPIDWSVECIRQAALGLEHAHQRGLVHRDIKPSNLLVLDAGSGDLPVVKILDMGLARFTSETQCSIVTQTGQVLGTIDYISPEQARDTKNVDIRTDIFALGATLYKLVTGRVPFEGRNAMERLMARAVREAPPASALRPELPAQLDAVIAKMLVRDRDQRYQTPGDVARALAPFALGTAGHTASDEASSICLPSSLQQGSDVHLKAEADHTLSAFLSHLATEHEAEETPALGVTETFAEGVAAEVAEAVVVQEMQTEVAPQQVTAEPVAPSAGATGRRHGQAGWFVAGLVSLGVMVLVCWLALGSRPMVDATGTPSERTDDSDSIPLPTGRRPVLTNAAPIPPQIRVLAQQLKEANPKFNGKLRWCLESEHVVALEIAQREISDLTPLRTVRSLRYLNISSNPLTDLEPLRGLPLEWLFLSNTQVDRLEPLTGMHLSELNLQGAPISDLSPLREMPLKLLDCRKTKVLDLSPLSGLPLETLYIAGTQVSSLKPLAGLRLNLLGAGNLPNVTDLSPLAGLPLTTLYLPGTPIADLQPLAAGRVTTLDISGTKVTDLAPLSRLPLVNLVCNQTGISSLAPLQGRPLKSLSCQQTPIASVEPLSNCPLEALNITNTAVEDLAPLTQTPLRSIAVDLFAERDLVALRKMKKLSTVNGLPIAEFWRYFDRPNDPPPGSQPIRLFDGKSLSGWKGDPKFWSVQDGILVGDGANTFLETVEKFENYQLHLRFRYQQGNSGIWLRRPDKTEVEITRDELQEIGDLHPGLFRTARDEVAKLYKPNDWNQLDITVDGARVRAVLNGHAVADYASATLRSQAIGKIGLQLGQVGAHVEFQAMELVKLPARLTGGAPPPVGPLYRLFEDEADFADGFDSGGGKAGLDYGAYAGKYALRVYPDQRVAQSLPGLGVRIAEHPVPGEFRYLRFGWRKRGGTGVQVQLRTDKGWFRMHAGKPRFSPSTAVAEELPSEWTVVTRDLFQDCGPVTLYGLALTPGDGQYALFDQIYLGQSAAAFDRCPQPVPPPAGAGGFHPLFDGKSLDGWEGEVGLWTVEEGAIVGHASRSSLRGNDTFLLTRRPFHDFQLRFDVQIRKGDSGLSFRLPNGLENQGRFEVNLLANLTGNVRTGDIYTPQAGIQARPNLDLLKAQFKPGAWNACELTAAGSYIQFKLNGQLLSEAVSAPEAVQPGPLGLQLWVGTGESAVAFRNLAVKELTAAELRALTEPDLQRGLVGHWTFDEDAGEEARDSSGHHHTGKIVGARRVPGVIGGGLDFRMGDCRVELGDVAQFEADQAFSYGAWIKLPARIAGAPIARMEAGPGFRGYDLFLDPQGVPHMHVIADFSTGDAIKVDGTRSLADGRWHHVFVAYNGSRQANTVRLYVDGRFTETKISKDGLQGSARTPVPLTIGGRAAGDVFRGLVDDVWVYDRALTGPEVAALFALGRSTGTP